MIRRIWLLGFLLTSVAVAAPGCATPQKVRSAENPAERLYLLGAHKLENGDYEGAIQKFDDIRNDYPYSKFAVRADLRIADAYFKSEDFASAAEQYRSFVKLHPKHPKVPYARFRVAMSRYEAMPGNMFLMPPAYERDLTKTRQASRAFRRFLRKHPDSEYADKARKLSRRVRRRLADHEFYVANFYMERDNPRGAAMRLKYLLNNYSGLGLDSRALFLLAKSHLQLGNVDRAAAALQDLIEYHPDSKYAEKARDYSERHNLKLDDV